MSTKKIKINSQIADLEAKLARALADYSNLEKRFQRDSSGIIKFANANILEKMLEIRDHLEMAANTITDPIIKILFSSFDKLLVTEGVVEIKTDGLFNPTTMECQEVAAGEKDQIISVSRRGYLLGDRVLRPARVIVGVGHASPESHVKLNN